MLEECLNALPYERLIQNPKLALLQAWLAQSQHRYGEVNTLLERAERTMREQKIEIDQTLHAEFDALRARWRSTPANRKKPSGWRPKR